jgi:hypothetical protein
MAKRDRDGETDGDGKKYKGGEKQRKQGQADESQHGGSGKKARTEKDGGKVEDFLHAARRKVSG